MRYAVAIVICAVFSAALSSPAMAASWDKDIAKTELEKFLAANCEVHLDDRQLASIAIRPATIDGDNLPDYYADLDPSIAQQGRCSLKSSRFHWLSSQGYSFDPTGTVQPTPSKPSSDQPAANIVPDVAPAASAASVPVQASTALSPTANVELTDPSLNNATTATIKPPESKNLFTFKDHPIFTVALVIGGIILTCFLGPLGWKLGVGFRDYAGPGYTYQDSAIGRFNAKLYWQFTAPILGFCVGGGVGFLAVAAALLGVMSLFHLG